MVTFHALWMLCALGAVALAAAPGRAPWPSLFALSLGCAAGVFWFGLRQAPTAESVGLLAAAAAATRLATSRATLVAAFVAGILIAVWTSLLRFESVPAWLAFTIAGPPPIVAAYLTPTRPRFAPAIVRDESLLFTLTLGLAVAVVPGILDGWRSAVALNLHDKSMDAVMLPPWTLMLSGGAVALGGVYCVWRRE